MKIYFFLFKIGKSQDYNYVDMFLVNYKKGLTFSNSFLIILRQTFDFSILVQSRHFPFNFGLSRMR